LLEIAAAKFSRSQHAEIDEFPHWVKLLPKCADIASFKHRAARATAKFFARITQGGERLTLRAPEVDGEASADLHALGATRLASRPLRKPDWWSLQTKSAPVKRIFDAASKERGDVDFSRRKL